MLFLRRLWPTLWAATPTPQKLTHTTSLCIVPPDDSPEWRAVQATRLELRDAGIYRWPPHCNLIYPFAAKPRLAARDARRACAAIAPFRLRLTAYGTFGGAKRGVLWLRPDVVGGDADSLATLQSTLCETLGYETPAARKRSLPFVPHFTLAHFESLAAAEAAGDALTFEPVEFDVDAVHLLEREGHGAYVEWQQSSSTKRVIKQEVVPLRDAATGQIKVPDAEAVAEYVMVMAIGDTTAYRHDRSKSGSQTACALC